MLRALLFLSSFIITVAFAALIYLLTSGYHQPLRAAFATQDQPARQAAMINAAEFEKAHVGAIFGCVPSQYRLGRFLASGEVGPVDKEGAAYWFEKAAVKGDADAQLALARLAFLGEGMTKDDAVGAAWVKKAAEAGAGRAKALLGVLYMGGIGIEQDIDTGMRWMKASGETDAQELYNVFHAKISVLDVLPEEERAARRSEIKTTVREGIRQSFIKMLSQEDKEAKGDTQ